MTIDLISQNKSKLLWIAPLFLLLIATYFIYLPGTHGFFILDDFPNLSPIGKYTNLNFWDNFWLYLLEGRSGPTGRPISLASFYLNASHWPAKPAGFIYTNILIHLVNGLLIFWISFKLSKLLQFSASQCVFVSLFASTFWLLHPMHTSTVLYVVQRMTELSASFLLMGIIFYLYGRETLEKETRIAFFLLFLGVGGSLALSILSKENGILMVGYILAIEYFLLRPFKQYPEKKFYYWFVPVVILPFLFVVIYLLMHINPDAYSGRNFTLAERLLSESRIIFDYLHHILLPRMGANTLFHDDYNISKNLFDPWTTVLAIVGIIALVITALLARKKHPFVSFAITWFFVGHLIESTVLPLELYFEHRNYLPIFGIMLAIAYYASKLLETHKSIVVGLSAVFILLFAFVTLQNSILWGKPAEQAYFWYKNHPNSLRTQEVYRPYAKLQGIDLDKVSIKNSMEQKSSLFYSTVSLLNLSRACSSHHITKKDLSTTLNVLQKHVVHTSVSSALDSFLKGWNKGTCKSLNLSEMEHFLLELTKINIHNKDNTFLYVVHYYLSDIYSKNNDLTNTMLHLDKSYEYQPDYYLLKKRARTLVSAGLFSEALAVLNDTSALEKGMREKLALSIKQKELDAMKSEINKRILVYKDGNIKLN